MTKKERLKAYKSHPKTREALFIRAADHPEHQRFIEMVAWCYNLEGIQRVMGWVDELDRRKSNADSFNVDRKSN